MASACCSSITAMRSSMPARFCANRSDDLSIFDSSTRTELLPPKRRSHSNRYLACMAPLSRELSLTDDELTELMTTCWNMRIATLGPGTRINLTPLWFGWAGGRIYFFGRGQKVVNLRRSPDCTVLVDRNERFPELQGAMFQGRGVVLEDSAAEA